MTVTGRVGSFNDFPCLSMMIPAFSRRAIDILSDMLVANGELLPLQYKQSDHKETGYNEPGYCAFNCSTIVEVLEHNKCHAMWMGDKRPTPALSIQRFAVHAELVQDLTVFRMCELCNIVFVTNKFVSRVHTHGLNGFDFVKVWPFPANVDYELEYARARRATLSNFVNKQHPDQLTVKAESLVIELPLSEAKISSAEKKQLSRLQAELDAQLVIRSLDEKYFGSLEARVTRRGVTRLIFSCPDCQALFAKLEPWLCRISWHRKPTVLLRRGSWDDVIVQEEPVKL